MDKLINSREYDEYLEQIGKKDSVIFRGIISFLKMSVTVKSTLICQDDLEKWSKVGDESLKLTIIVLDDSRDVPMDPPTSYFDALYLKLDDTISYCDTIGDYNFGSGVFLGDIGILDKYQYNDDNDNCIVKMHRLEKSEIDYYLDLMNRYDISRKKYFEYKNRLEEAKNDEILERKEQNKKNVKNFFGTIILGLIVFIVIKTIFKW